jgi:hypothetical protein
MTAIDVHTGELVKHMTEGDARRLTERIRALLGSVQDQVDKLVRLVEQAQTEGAWIAMGYRSWTEYAEQEFRQPLRLPRPERQQLEIRLAEMGMSTRAIAPITGVTRRQVGRDLSGGTFVPPEEGDLDQPTLDDEPDRLAPNPEPRITGRDGKSYPKQQRRQPNRSALPETYHQAVGKLWKDTERLLKLAQDDRYSSNASAITQRCAPELLRSMTVITAAVGRLDPAALPEDEEARHWWVTSLDEIAETIHRFRRTLKES